MKTRAQVWSKAAFESVRATKDHAQMAKYNTSCMRMPGLIHQSGALQALVFQVARDEMGQMYVDHLAAAYFVADTTPPSKGHERLIKHAQSLELKAYLALTRDLAAIAQWFRRFAQIELGGDN
jgi:CRISPR-associated protein Cmr5